VHAQLVHRRHPEADLPVAVRDRPVNGRQKERTSDGACGQGTHSNFIDGNLDGIAFCNRGNGTVAFKISEQGGVGPTLGSLRQRH
jgi:hypothetical protein